MRKVFLAIACMALALACAPKETAPVKKDMCVQMYSARSIINHDNYADGTDCAAEAVIDRSYNLVQRYSGAQTVADGSDNQGQERVQLELRRRNDNEDNGQDEKYNEHDGYARSSTMVSAMVWRIR